MQTSGACGPVKRTNVEENLDFNLQLSYNVAMYMYFASDTFSLKFVV